MNDSGDDSASDVDTRQVYTRPNSKSVIYMFNILMYFFYGAINSQKSEMFIRNKKKSEKCSFMKKKIDQFVL